MQKHLTLMATWLVLFVKKQVKREKEKKTMREKFKNKLIRKTIKYLIIMAVLILLFYIRMQRIKNMYFSFFEDMIGNSNITTETLI